MQESLGGQDKSSSPAWHLGLFTTCSRQSSSCFTLSRMLLPPSHQAPPLKLCFCLGHSFEPFPLLPLASSYSFCSAQSNISPGKLSFLDCSLLSWDPAHRCLLLDRRLPKSQDSHLFFVSIPIRLQNAWHREGFDNFLMDERRRFKPLVNKPKVIESGSVYLHTQKMTGNHPETLVTEMRTVTVERCCGDGCPWMTVGRLTAGMWRH